MNDQAYTFTELSKVLGHHNFILTALLDRYNKQYDKEAYIIVLHHLDTNHYILGIYDDLREAYQTQFICNSILLEFNPFEKLHINVHHISGTAIQDKVFDPETNTVISTT